MPDPSDIEVKIVYYKSRVGRYHFKVSGRSFEQDNLERLSKLSIVSLEEVQKAPPERLCKRCFPLK